MRMKLRIAGAVVTACGFWTATCTDDPGVAGSDVVGEALIELHIGGSAASEGMNLLMDYGGTTVAIDPEGMNRLLDNGGDGPVRYRIRGPDGEIVAEVRGKNFEEVESRLRRQARPMAEGLASSWRQRVESMTPEERLEMLE